MTKHEAKFGMLFRHWIFANPMFPAAFELKQTNGDSIPFSAVPEHQLDALIAAENNKGILYKAPDDSRGVKPFDYFYLNNADGFVVIRYPTHFVMIRVLDFKTERDKSQKEGERKSLTFQRAKEIAYKVVKI